MKARLMEFDEVFLIELTSEDMLNAAQIALFGLNATKELRHKSVSVSKDGTFCAELIIGKRKQPKSKIG